MFKIKLFSILVFLFLVNNSFCMNCEIFNDLILLMQEDKIPEFLEKLKKINVNIKDPDTGATILMFASAGGYRKLVKALVDIEGIDKDAQDNLGDTALIHAAHNGFVEIGQILLDNMADINIKNNKGKTAFDIAKENGKKDFVNLLENYKNQQSKACVIL